MLERYNWLLIDDENADYAINNDYFLTYQQTMEGKDFILWIDAMKSKMCSMYKNEIWTLENVPDGVIPISCKAIFKKKIGANGKVNTYIARLVVKGMFIGLHALGMKKLFDRLEKNVHQT